MRRNPRATALTHILADFAPMDSIFTMVPEAEVRSVISGLEPQGFKFRVEPSGRGRRVHCESAPKRDGRL